MLRLRSHHQLIVMPLDGKLSKSQQLALKLADSEHDTKLRMTLLSRTYHVHRPTIGRPSLLRASVTGRHGGVHRVSQRPRASSYLVRTVVECEISISSQVGRAHDIRLDLWVRWHLLYLVASSRWQAKVNFEAVVDEPLKGSLRESSN